MSTTKDKDEDSSTKQILEYYRKYSQSKDLPKYFSGSVQYLPKIVDDDDEESIKSQIENNYKTEESERERCENIDQELSPTGSLASNRKLEWDSLGDIGYIQRSASLPILTKEKHFENETNKGENVKIVILPYTSSSEENSEGKNTIHSSLTNHSMEKDISTVTSEDKQKLLTSDSESLEYVQKFVDFQESLDYLKRKIGLPDAHSTPNEPHTSKGNLKIKSNPHFPEKSEYFLEQLKLLSNKEIRNVEVDENKEIPLNPKKKVINLCVTKPVLLDCLPHTNTIKPTVAIQTDESLKTVPKQSEELVTFYKHSDALKTSTDSGKSTSSNAGIVTSKCDSFEYVKINGEDISVEKEVPQSNNSNEDPISLVKSNLAENDIEKGIYVLQRLMKSKKYDSSTKKKYIKKILQKITESKYLNDSSSSSDLFYPKADTAKILQDYQKSGSFNSSNQPYEEMKSPNKCNKSDSTDSDKTYEKEKKANTSNSESKPSTSKVKNVHSSPKKDKKEVILSSNGAFKKYDEAQHPKETKKTLFTVTKCPEISSDHSSSPQSYQNWKELKTVSEKIFESNGQTVGGGDNRSQFVNNEREYQLHLINKEINHLGKLKNILEKTKKTCPSPKCMKKTTVYTVSANNNKEINRKYVIETKLSSIASSLQRNFRLNGKNYTVKDQNCPDISKDSQPVVADIQVQSTDQGTNIKVTTFCNICKRAPCVCVTNFLQGISNPFQISENVVKEHLENKSNSCTCSYNSTISTNTTSGTESSKTICINCHRSPCTCCSCKQTHNVKTCSVCNMYSCMCDVSPKGSAQLEPFVKEFIPIIPHDPTSDKQQKKSCPKCQAYPCICQSSSNDSTSKKETSSTSTTTNSLTKVFVDCKCGPSLEECRCNFVDKLVKHFNPALDICPDQKKDKKNNIKFDEKLSVTTQNQAPIYSERGTSSKAATSDKGVDCSCPQTFCDKSIGTCNKKASVDCSTSPRTCLVDKGTECEPRGSLVDQTTSPRYVQVDKGTSSGPRESLIEKGTSNSPILVDKGSKCSSRKASSDKSTSSSELDKRNEVDSKSLVDKHTSPVTLNVDKEIDCNPMTYKDQFTCTCSCQVDQGSENIKKTSLEDGTSVAFCSSRDNRNEIDSKSLVDKHISPVALKGDKENDYNPTGSKDQFTSTYSCRVDKGNVNVKKTSLEDGTSLAFYSNQDFEVDPKKFANKETGTGTKPEIIGEESTRAVSKVSKIDRCTVTTSEAAVNTKISDTKFYKTQSTQTENLACRCKYRSSKSNSSTSVNVQTDLLSKDFRSCSSKSTKEPVKKLICICAPLEIHKKSHKPKIICLRGSEETKRKSKSSSLSNSRNEEKRCCRCSNVKKTRAKRRVSETNDSTSTTNLSSNCTCFCCGTNVPLERISLLRNDDREFPVCKECLDKRQVLTTGSSTNTEIGSSSDRPEYTKNCLKPQNFCTCIKKPSKADVFVYCSHCENRLRKTQQNRNGIAYTLTLEDELPEKFKTRAKKKMKKLEEIKIKVPNPYSRKQRKDNENNHKRNKDKMKKVESRENSEDEQFMYCNRTKIETSLKTDSSSTTNHKKINSNCTLQEYLKRNRPGFVNAAEFRRLALINNRIERELNKDDLKLKFLEKNINDNVLKRERLFSEQEMREITRRNYKKLPEVQQKLIDKRLQKLRNADKFMAEALKRKIQNCVLKGKSSFPIDTNVVNVYK